MELVYDPQDEATQDNPYPIYRRLRDECPAYRQEHGVTIPAGEKVLLLFGSANRDEREFPDPDRLDLSRDATHHLAFGYGAHYCIGASLARLMGRIAFEELTTRLSACRIHVERGRRLRAAVSRGWEHLPVELG